MSKYSVKNVRQLSKEATRQLILEKTKELIIAGGVLKTSTKQIADSSRVAHGTIFSHFNNREQLISSVIKQELIRIAKELYQFEEQSHSSFEKLLREYLVLVSREEDLLVVLSKEFPFFSDDLKREIITTETIVKKLFYNKIREGIDKNIFKPVNIPVALSFLFGTLHFYLSRKEYFVSKDSVINEQKEEIMTIFINILKQ